MSSNYDIIVFGATGFTGRLITRYLASHPQFKDGSFTFALGARSQSKLHNLIQELGLPKEIGTVSIDVTNPNDVERAVKQARVIINTVGPYWRWGTPVVRACALNGVHYVDLTGESVWIRDIILRFDYVAMKTGAVIVPSCGMDSIPADLTTFLSNKTLKAKGDYDVHSSNTAYQFMGGISGGTFSTMMVMFDEVPRQKRMESTNDWILSPFKGRRIAPIQFIYNLGLPREKPLIGAFFFMQPTNRKLVQRTAGLLEQQARESTAAPDVPSHVREIAKRERYGSTFTYDEFMVVQSKVLAFVITTAFAVGFGMIAFLPPLRWALKRWGPQSGDGPSEETQKNGWLRCTNHTVSTSTPPVRVKTVLKGQGDPGYALTAVMIAESALSLLIPPTSSSSQSSTSDHSSRGSKSLPEGLPSMAYKGGILTPMTAFGDVLITRLRDSGKFEFESQICGADSSSPESRKDI